MDFSSPSASTISQRSAPSNMISSPQNKRTLTFVEATKANNNKLTIHRHRNHGRKLRKTKLKVPEESSLRKAKLTQINDSFSKASPMEANGTASNAHSQAQQPQKTLQFEVEEEIIDESAKNLSSFERFCNCTSLHGWKYMSSHVNRTLRVGWVAVVLASMGVAAFFLGYSCNDFLSSTVQTTQDTSR